VKLYKTLVKEVRQGILKTAINYFQRRDSGWTSECDKRREASVQQFAERWNCADRL